MKSRDLLTSSCLIAFLLIVISACQKDDEVVNRNPNQGPTCQIFAPRDGQEIAWGEIFTIVVKAEDYDGAVKKIILFIDGHAKDTSVSFPYHYEWSTAYENTGMHTIHAISIDNGGLRNHAYVTIKITPDGDAPVAAYTASPASGSSPLTVEFTDQSTKYPSSWKWDFGDGHYSTQQNPSHTYSGDWSYTVSLTVTNPNGSDIEMKSKYINVGGVGQACPGTPTISWKGQTYHTVLIGSQCWMKENLNYAIGNSWCYDNNPNNCSKYGRLYDWATIMNGSASSNTIPSGVQGICPDGWHVPSDREWRTLEGTTDSLYAYGYSGWNDLDWRGFDAGKRLKSTSGWYSGGNGTDDFGFSALPGAYRNFSGFFYYLKEGAYFWTSTRENSDDARYRRLYYSRDQVERNYKK